MTSTRSPSDALKDAIACEAHGGTQTSLGKAIERSQGFVSMLLHRLENGHRSVVPADDALKIEAATGGKVSRVELNPEFPWAMAADPAAWAKVERRKAA